MIKQLEPLRRRLTFFVDVYKTNGSTDDRSRSERPKVTTPKEDRQIRLLNLRNRQAITVVDTNHNVLERIDNQPSNSAKPTHHCGLKVRRQYKGTELTDWHSHDFMTKLGTTSLALSIARVVLFSDESRFSLSILLC